MRDKNNRPIAGAAVLFAAPGEGPSGTFTGGSPALRVTTDAEGRASGQGFQPNTVQGEFNLNVTVTVGDVTQTVAIHMKNVGGASSNFLHRGAHGKLIVIVATLWARRLPRHHRRRESVGGGSSPGAVPTTITAGTGTVGGR